jgi:hypothetical protein
MPVTSFYNKLMVSNFFFAFPSLEKRGRRDL